MARNATKARRTDTPATEAPVVTEATDTATPATEATATATPAEATDTDTPATEATATDPSQTFVDTWQGALDGRDPSTGTVAESPLASVVASYRALTPSKRTSLLLQVTTEATAAAMATAPAIDVSLLTASQAMAEALRASGTAPAAPVVTTLDRMEALALALASLGASVSVSFDGSDIATPADVVAAVGADPSESDTPAIVRARRVLAASAGKGGKRASGARRASGGKRGSAIADHITEVLGASGEPMKVGAIAKAMSSHYPEADVRPSQGAIAGAIARGGIEGVEAVTVDGSQGARAIA